MREWSTATASGGGGGGPALYGGGPARHGSPIRESSTNMGIATTQPGNIEPDFVSNMPEPLLAH